MSKLNPFIVINKGVFYLIDTWLRIPHSLDVLHCIDVRLLVSISYIYVLYLFAGNGLRECDAEVIRPLIEVTYMLYI